MQDVSTVLFVSAGCVLVISTILVLIKRTRKRALLLFSGSILFLCAIIRLEVFHDKTGYFLLFFLADALIISSAVLGLVRLYKTSRTELA